MAAVMNAANEVAVDLFLNAQIPFLQIMRLVERAMDQHEPLPPTLPNVLEADTWARRFTREQGA